MVLRPQRPQNAATRGSPGHERRAPRENRVRAQNFLVLKAILGGPLFSFGAVMASVHLHRNGCQHGFCGRGFAEFVAILSNAGLRFPDCLS